MSGLLRRDDVTPGYTLFPREIFRRNEEDRRRRCRWHRRGDLTKYPAEKIRGTAGVVRELGLVLSPQSVKQVFHSALFEPFEVFLPGGDDGRCGLARLQTAEGIAAGQELDEALPVPIDGIEVAQRDGDLDPE